MCSAFVIIISVRYTHTHTDAVCIPIYNLKKTIASFGWGGSFSGNRACKARFFFIFTFRKSVEHQRQTWEFQPRISTLSAGRNGVSLSVFFSFFLRAGGFAWNFNRSDTQRRTQSRQKLFPREWQKYSWISSPGCVNRTSSVWPFPCHYFWRRFIALSSQKEKSLGWWITCRLIAHERETRKRTSPCLIIYTVSQSRWLLTNTHVIALFAACLVIIPIVSFDFSLFLCTNRRDARVWPGERRLQAKSSLHRLRWQQHDGQFAHQHAGQAERHGFLRCLHQWCEFPSPAHQLLTSTHFLLSLFCFCMFSAVRDRDVDDDYDVRTRALDTWPWETQKKTRKTKKRKWEISRVYYRFLKNIWADDRFWCGCACPANVQFPSWRERERESLLLSQ